MTLPSQTGRVAGKVALITGAAHGQGAAEAAMFVAEGARVMLADRDIAAGRALAEALGDDNAAFVELDVAHAGEWSNAVAATTRQFGKLDILINNAGIFWLGSIEDTPPEKFMEIVHVNQLGTFLGMRTAIPALRANGGGSIVNISSTLGLAGSSQMIAYTGTKWAIRGMTKAAALELSADNIRVNSVHPGAVKTDMTSKALAPNPALPFHDTVIPMTRWATPEEVAQLVLFVASDACSYSTGSEFVCDGGLTAL